MSAARRRVAAVVEYDGGAYAGWQFQAHAPSIQDAVQRAIGFVAGHAVEVVCAGRTDAGVHAVGQVVHFETDVQRTGRAWVLGANTRLPRSIALQWAGEVEPGFHARYSAIRRTYRYCILNRSARSALADARAAWVHRPLDADAMTRAAQVLLGEHDFSAFRASECQSMSPVRRIESARVTREGDFVWVDLAANAFLHHMVRNIVGTLIEVQTAPDPVAAMAAVLAARDRKAAGMTAPAAGLYLWRVDYPPAFEIPTARAAACGFAPVLV
ncbi:MAG: tRNA pseudouridine(38-40) synthase TruA [Gammaproteobacteria bacterium]|nr:tRNA pseudouridine(38-40) synthase TruA [Gammaproteobacteria bacterium]